MPSPALEPLGCASSPDCSPPLVAFSTSALTISWVFVQAVLSTDPFMAEASAIHIVNIADDIADQKDKVVRKLSGPKGRITRLVWTDLNRVVISASEDGFVRRWDVEVRAHGYLPVPHGSTLPCPIPEVAPSLPRRTTVCSNVTRR